MPSRTRFDARTSTAGKRGIRPIRAMLAAIVLSGSAAFAVAVSSPAPKLNGGPHAAALKITAQPSSLNAAARIARGGKPSAAQNYERAATISETPPFTARYIPELLMTAAAALAIIRRTRIHERRAPLITVIA